MGAAAAFATATDTLGTGVDVLGTGVDTVGTSVGERPSLRILGTRVDLFPSAGSVLQNLMEQSQGGQRHLCYVNAHSLNLACTDIAYKQALAHADLVLNDGIGLQLAAKMRGARFAENLNGSDFTVRILQLAADRGWRVFFYGGEPGVAQAAGEHLMSEIDGLDVVDVCDGYSSEDPSDVILRIRAAQADVLVVALGQPKQELWLDQYLADTGCHLGLGVGAFLDFASGRMTRAPRWMNELGVEWLFRLAQEPGRMWRRYVFGNPVFLWHAWRHRRRDQEALV
jgi:exopolysaccharide biosynthesis WecB/TagA/CpsF family protein